MSTLDLTSDDYARAFRIVEAEGIPENPRALLQAHASAPGHTASWRTLAQMVGRAHWQQVNLQYGTLSKRIGKALGMVAPPIRGRWLYLFVDEAERDHLGHRQFVLRQPVVDAAVRLGLITATTEV